LEIALIDKNLLFNSTLRLKGCTYNFTISSGKCKQNTHIKCNATDNATDDKFSGTCLFLSILPTSKATYCANRILML